MTQTTLFTLPLEYMGSYSCMTGARAVTREIRTDWPEVYPLSLDAPETLPRGGHVSMELAKSIWIIGDTCTAR